MDIEHAIAEVRAWLNLIMVSGRYSAGFARELALHMQHRTLSIFPIFDEIAVLENGANARRTNTIKATPFRGAVLKGLLHKHFFQPAFLAKNIERHWAKPGKWEARQTQILDTDKIPPGMEASRLIHDFVIGGYTDRSSAGQTTGEWIVYASRDGVNYYLTLGVHSEPDQSILDRVLACCDEFPSLEVCRKRGK